MKRLWSLAFFAVVLAGCPKPGPTPVGPTPTQTFADCTGAVLTAAEGEIAVVTADLLSQNYVALLATLGASVGLPEVKCAVELAVGEMTKRAQRSDDSQVALVVAHGNSWLATH